MPQDIEAAKQAFEELVEFGVPDAHMVSSSSSSYICRGFGPLVDPFQSHVSRSSVPKINGRGVTQVIDLWLLTALVSGTNFLLFNISGYVITAYINSWSCAQCQ
jgi:hypothetical protein